MTSKSVPRGVGEAYSPASSRLTNAGVRATFFLPGRRTTRSESFAKFDLPYEVTAIIFAPNNSDVGGALDNIGDSIPELFCV